MSRVIVAGSGIAGLTAALCLSGRHTVTLVTKDRLGESNTEWAQGGIAGVIGPDDTVASHIADTLTAGAGHCDPEAVRTLCEAGGDETVSLAEAGVEFDTDQTGAWARGMEGAHSYPRIFHSGGDATGRAISTALAEKLRAEVAAGRVTLLEDTMLVDILTSDDEHRPVRATGITVLRNGRVETLTADAADVIMKQIARRGARAVLAGASKEVSTRLGYAAEKNRVLLVERNDIDIETLFRN